MTTTTTRIVRPIFILCLAFAAFGQPAIAADAKSSRTLHVALDGDDSNDGFSAAKALRTPQRAADISEPGDTILFAAGSYDISEGKALLTITRSGEAGRPITYAPAPGAKVTFRTFGIWDVIKITAARHIVIRGFRIIGGASLVTMEEARREMNNLLNPRTSGNGIAIVGDRSTRRPSAYITVRDCEVSDCSGGGIFANHSDYIRIENNTVYRCAFWAPYGNSGISIYQPTPIDDYTGYKIYICNNVAYENYQNIPFYYSNQADPSKRKVTDGNGIILDDFLNTQTWAAGGSGKPYNGRTLVANNIVFSNGGSGIHTFKSCNIDIVHNYAADNNRHSDIKDGQIFANTSRDVRILNNVLVAFPGKPVTSDNKNTNVEMARNFYATADGRAPQFAGERGDNVLAASKKKARTALELVDWARGKRTFRAVAKSPLHGAGAALPMFEPEVAVDFFGRSRNAQTPDIGPFVLDRK